MSMNLNKRGKMKKISLILSIILLSVNLYSEEVNKLQVEDKLDVLDKQSKEFFKSITGLEKTYLEEQMQEIKNKKDEADKGIKTQNPQAVSNSGAEAVVMTEEEYEKNVFNHQNEIARITTDFTRTRKIKDLKIKSMYSFNGKDYAVLLLNDSESTSQTKSLTELSGNIEGRYVEGDNILGLKIIDINTRTKSIELFKKLDEDTGYTIYLSNHGINVSNLEKIDKNDPRYTKTAPKNMPKREAIYTKVEENYQPVQNLIKKEPKIEAKIERKVEEKIIERKEFVEESGKKQADVKKAFEEIDTKMTTNNAKNECYIVNKQNLNVRIEPSESSRILRVMKINDVFLIQNKKDNWLNINTIYKKVSGDIMDVSTQSNWVQDDDGSLSKTACK
jgi:hypothetical protein